MELTLLAKQIITFLSLLLSESRTIALLAERKKAGYT
jgi:hypothetical protein